MKIAILYIVTGKYEIFWPEFYSSCEEFFCQGIQKHYFVFTDSAMITQKDNVTRFEQDNLGWPFNTLYRYRIFLRAETLLKDYDYIVFFNSNAKFVANITTFEFFGANKGLVAAIHPGYYNVPPERFPIEKRGNSLAYLATSEYYFQGAINGGSSHEFLEVINILAQNIETDLDNGIMPIWHDESHWNAYLNQKRQGNQLNLQILMPGYIYPEQLMLPFPKKIVMRDKNRYGGHDFLRGTRNAGSNEVNFFSKIVRKILCK